MLGYRVARTIPKKSGPPMNRVYEVVEVLPNGSRQMVTVVSGLEFAKAALEDLAKHTHDECFAVDAETHQVVMQLNVESAKLQATKRVFQIAYDEELALQRTQLLKSQGYIVMSVIGNEAAKVVLSATQHYDLFIVDHAALEETRREIVDWLRANYAKAKILALNPCGQQIPSADFNVADDTPDKFVPIVAQHLLHFADILGASNASSNRDGPTKGT
jgi:CheY-like chemotaxis protein